MGNLLFSNNTLRRLSFSSGFTRALGKKSKGRLKTFFRQLLPAFTVVMIRLFELNSVYLKWVVGLWECGILLEILF